jgi:hypothetical protein
MVTPSISLACIYPPAGGQPVALLLEPGACAPVAGGTPAPLVLRPWRGSSVESQWNSPGDVTGLGVGAIL